MNSKFQKWGLNYSGCDGGDIGKPNHKSKWVCGIEWGGGHDYDSLLSSINEDLEGIPEGYDSWEENISYIFNWQVMKLLSAIEGGKVDEYKLFAERKKPFVNGSQGYFKMNLYPIAFKNTNSENWISSFSNITGFNSKDEYIQWCKKERFFQLRKWASRYSPELIICLGKTYKTDFKVAFYEENKEFKTECVEDHEISWGVNNDGTLVVILPFMVNKNGLVKNIAIQKVGNRISELLNEINESC